MRIAKYTYPPMVLIFGLGLLYSQARNVICSVSNCSKTAPDGRAANVEHAGHCRQFSQKVDNRRIGPCPMANSAWRAVPPAAAPRKVGEPAPNLTILN